MYCYNLFVWLSVFDIYGFCIFYFFFSIRTWICRLNFAQSLLFQAWGSLMSMKSHTRDPQLKVPPGGLVFSIFTSWKNSSISVGFEPAILGSRDEHVTPKPPRSTNLWLAECINLHGRHRRTKYWQRTRQRN